MVFIALAVAWRFWISRIRTVSLSFNVECVPNHKKSHKRRPGAAALLLWSLETRRHEPKINMVEKLVDVKLRQRGKIGSTYETPVRQYTVKNVPVLSLFFSRLLPCSFFRVKELFKSKKWFNYLVTFFFGKCQENLGRLDDAKRRKETESMP